MVIRDVPPRVFLYAMFAAAGALPLGTGMHSAIDASAVKSQTQAAVEMTIGLSLVGVGYDSYRREAEHTMTS